MKKLKKIGIRVAIIGGLIAFIGGLSAANAEDIIGSFIGGIIGVIGGLIASIGIKYLLWAGKMNSFINF